MLPDTAGKPKVDAKDLNGKDPRKGAALVLGALMCLAIIPMVGLAIDGSRAYMMRAQLSRALDAAALAGARSLNAGLNITAQSASATAMAQKFFNANLPAGMWGASNVSSSITVAQNDTTHVRSVTIVASADIPLQFMGLLSAGSIHVSMTAQAQRRDVNIMLVLDNSGSMQRGNAMGPMITDATDFVNMFAGGRDHLGLIQYTGTPYLAYAPSVNFKSDSPNVTTLIGELTSANGATNSAAAIWMAYQQLKNLNQPGALNVIVLFTDGLANTYTADFSQLIKSCSGYSTPLNGVLFAYVDNSGIVGLSDPTAKQLNDTSESRPAPTAGNCVNTFPTGSIANYLTALPSTDINGNSTNGTGTMSAYAPVNINSIDPPDVTNSGLNALDDAANRIRSDSTYTPLIYVVGLGSNPGLPPDQVLMARVANDPSSPSYNSSQQAGLFVEAPTIAQLSSAFQRVASEVLRLAH
jgi:Flp pilus assembly protein TadG